MLCFVLINSVLFCVWSLYFGGRWRLVVKTFHGRRVLCFRHRGMSTLSRTSDISRQAVSDLRRLQWARVQWNSPSCLRSQVQDQLSWEYPKMGYFFSKKDLRVWYFSAWESMSGSMPTESKGWCWNPCWKRWRLWAFPGTDCYGQATTPPVRWSLTLRPRATTTWCASTAR